MNLHAYPKVELHLHLDLSLSYEVVHVLDPTISPERYRRDFLAPAKCPNLMECLSRASQAIALMQTAENLRLVVKDLLFQLQQDHVLYAEIRFAPLLHTQQGLLPSEVVSVVEAATTEASHETGVEARVLLCTLRHFTAKQSMQTVRLVEQFQGTSVVGFDLAGDEAGFALDAHLPAFHYARTKGIAYTAHAGEAKGAESVWETLYCLNPPRIGHGVRSIEDQALVEKLRTTQIHLEICPTSNIQTNAYATYAEHPVDRLYQGGVSLNINTDARTLTPITLTQEYEAVRQTFGWVKGQFLHSNRCALRASFLPEAKKRELDWRLQQA